MLIRRVSARLGVALLLCLSVGCATTHKSRVPVYEITVDEPQRIRFSGKGAGAGIMMMSSMGSMGIAIGVAIDEGIAKSIHESFIEKGHSLEGLVSSAVEQVLQTQSTAKTEPAILHVQLHRIGIKMAGGETVAADIAGEIRIGEHSYELKAVPQNKPENTLDEVKVDGDLAYRLLHDALTHAIQQTLDGRENSI